MSTTVYESPLGPLLLIGDGPELTRLRFPDRSAEPRQHDSKRLEPVVAQLDEYFAGERCAFDLPLSLGGTPFQHRVWRALQQIPYATTTTYGALARKLSTPGSEPLEPRVVAGAIARAPTPIVVPCHRVIGADGSLTGYLGGLDRKRALLDFEASGGNSAALSPGWGKQLTLA